METIRIGEKYYDVSKLTEQATSLLQDLPSLAEKPRPSGRGWIGKKSDCLIYCTIIILKISKYGDFQ